MSFSPSASRPHLLHVGHDGYCQGDPERQVLKVAELPISPVAQMVKNLLALQEAGFSCSSLVSTSLLVETTAPNLCFSTLCLSS